MRKNIELGGQEGRADLGGIRRKENMINILYGNFLNKKFFKEKKVSLGYIKLSQINEVRTRTLFKCFLNMHTNLNISVDLYMCP